jgi:hypothetical protein
MTKFIVGVVLGFALATIGVSGVARVIDNGVQHVQSAIKGVSAAELDGQVTKAKEAVTEATK